MTRVCLLHGVDRQRPDCIDAQGFQLLASQKLLARYHRDSPFGRSDQSRTNRRLRFSGSENGGYAPHQAVYQAFERRARTIKAENTNLFGEDL